MPPAKSELIQGEDELAVASASAQDAINQCAIETPSCVADALDAYADALEKLARNFRLACGPYPRSFAMLRREFVLRKPCPRPGGS